MNFYIFAHQPGLMNLVLQCNIIFPVQNMLSTSLIILCTVFIEIASSYNTMPPDIRPSSNIQVGTLVIYNSTTTATSNPSINDDSTISMVFTTPFSAAPQLGTAISQYETNKNLTNLVIKARVSGSVTATSFKISLDVSSPVYRLVLKYIAVSNTFPYHMNIMNHWSSSSSFNTNNLTVKSYTVNYSSYSYTYKTFSTPYTKYKFVFYIACFQYAGGPETNSTPIIPQFMSITAQAINTSYFQINFSVGNKLNLKTYHYTIIIFDEDQIINSRQYTLIYKKFNWTAAIENTIYVPPEYQNYVIFGWTDFNSDQTQLFPCFDLIFSFNISNNSGILMPPSKPTSLTTYGFSMFYAKQIICITPTYFYNITAELCIECAYIDGCLQCINQTYCTQCNSSLVLSPSKLCVPCPILNCNQCFNYSRCQECDYLGNYSLLANYTCGYCDYTQNKFINMNSTGKQCVKCTINQCVTCDSLAVCSYCNQTNNYYPNPLNNQCQVCPVFQCLWCKNATHCKTCNQSNRYFLNSTTEQCEICQLEGCIKCSSLQVCQICNANANLGLDHLQNLTLCGPCNSSCTCDGYVEPWNDTLGQCSSLCGDGLIRVNEQCDDGNTQKYDGCSSDCKIEQYYICVDEPSNCTSTFFIDGKLNSIQRQGCNSFSINISEPSYPLDQIKENIILLNPGIFITAMQQQSSNIIIHCSYTKNIENQYIMLYFEPGSHLKIEYNPIIPALYYQPHQCQIENTVQNLVTFYQISSYVVLLFSLFSCKIVGLELFGILQVSYFTLSQNSYLNMLMAPLVKFKLFNGINIPLFTESSSLSPILSSMDVRRNFLNNCNIMLLILFADIIVASVLYFLSKFTDSKRMQKCGKFLLKEGLITLVLFNCFNISFSAGVHWQYGDPNSQGYFLGTIALVVALILMLASVSLLELTSEKSYGEFKNKFKKECISKIYITATAAFRMIVGFYCAIQSKQSHSTIITLVLSLGFLLYFIVNLPFKNIFQNYRAFFIHFTCAYIFFNTNYYRTMKSNTPLSIKAFIFAPAIIQLALIIICIFVSLIILGYEIYGFYRKCSPKNRIIEDEQQVLNKRASTEESIAAMGQQSKLS